jgi:hypothetical protein
MSQGSARSSQQRFRLTVVPVAVLLTLVLAALIGTLQAPEGRGQLGGDFPAFYGAGSVVNESGYDKLYDAATQRAAQDGLIANEGGYLFFAYPPFVATAYSWLAAFDYRVAYLIQMVLMGAAAAASVLLLRPVSQMVQRYPWAVLATVVLFEPLLASLIGGQNTALTMLLLAAAVRAELSGRPFVAGLAVGLLAYKPQYGVPLALLVAMGGRWRVLTGTAATWAALYLAGAVTSGIGWVGPWWEQATSFRDTNATVNGPLFVSWAGYVEHITGMGGAAGQLLGLAIGAGGLVGLAWLWRRPGSTIEHRYAAAAVGLVLIAPQSLFYEAGLGVISLLLLADGDRRWRVLAAATWVAGWLYVVTAGLVNTTVLVLALTTIGGAALMLALRSRRDSAEVTA